jgi:hypothetical protein
MAGLPASSMAKGMDATVASSMEAAKVRQQQAELVQRIVSQYEGKGLPVAKVIQLKASLMGIVSSGGTLTMLEQRVTTDHLAIDPLIAAAEQIRKTLRPAIPRTAPAAAPRPQKPDPVPCYRCGKLLEVGDTACQFCRTPLRWSGNRNGPIA